MPGFDIFLVLCGAALLFVVVAVAMAFAYHLGNATGRAAERLRWHEAEMRLERRIIEDALSGDEFWQKELDV